ncbi:MAG: GWxTD domain-containing protein [Ignavibacteriaceae bacterium]|nr:GWxTD domain-containing protein [Ignavibacteriaceae bacterium]
MKYLNLILFFSILNFSMTAQDKNSSINKKQFMEATYFQDFVNFYSGSGSTSRVDIFIQVPYKNLQFVKSNQGFTAKYSVTTSVFDSSKKKLVVEKTWNETINVIDYNIAASKENYNLSKRSFELDPGNYYIRTMLEDKDSKKESVGENNFIVKTYDKNISLSDILFVFNKESAQTKNEIIPNVSRNIPSSKDRIKFYFEVYLKDSIDTRLTFEYSVFGSENTIVHKDIEDRNIKPGTNQILYTFNEFPFDLGIYNLVITVSDSSNKIIDKTSKAFYSHWKGLPAIITDIDKAIAQTLYIATPAELEFMQGGQNVQEKTKRFLEFWKKKDPSPNNDENEFFDEYFRRISIANENFSSYIEGWKSDRGMVYTILGAPNNIDRHPFEYDTKPYEVWEYYDLNRRLVFMDETGFGDYRLITPLTGDLYRYRY